MRVDVRQLRNCLGHFTTGVTVVTCDAGGKPHGATVNSFTAISLDPPLVMIALDRRSRACLYLEDAPFTANVLRAKQDGLARLFASKDKVGTVEWAPPQQGCAPRLADPLAYLACRPWRAYNGGDHVLFLGQVAEFEHFGGDPLVFYRGGFSQLSVAEPWQGSADSPNAGWFSSSVCAS